MRRRAHGELTDSRHYGRRDFAAPPARGEAKRLLDELAREDCGAGPREPSRPITLYGGGDMGRMAHAYFAALGYKVDLVVDRSAESLRADPFWAGTVIMHPDEVPAATRRATLLMVCVATAPFKPLEAELAADGWEDIVPFYDVAESQRARHPLSNGWFAPQLDAADLDQVRRVLDEWADDLSRAHHLQFLAWRRLRQEWTFAGAPVTGDDRFFIPEVTRRATQMDLFVDGGAHHGQVARRFAALRAGAASRIVAIEPDPENAEVIRSVPWDADARITILPAALGAEAGERRFHRGLGYASQFAATGKGTVPVVTLDSLGLAPGFIKLHLEGAELDALRGARETLRRHRPVLAVTTYHNADGIWRTPAWLMENLKGYRFLMRLHSWCGTGAVVYALPDEG